MHQPRLSIVVPVFNEEQTLSAIIERLYASCGEFSQLIFVDDGSKDRSLEILRSLARPTDIVVTKENGGKGSAVRKGYSYAQGTYTIVQDADLEYSPEEIPLILRFAEEKDIPAVFGSRRLKKQKQFVHLTFFIGGSMLTFICNALYRTKLTDQPTCYKMVRTDILKTLPLQENDFRFDPELTVMLARRSVPIREFPISYRPRSVEEGKKINWRDWFKWVWVFLSLRIRSYRYFEVSHS
ncbi:MAG: glycosyl transferase 2 [Candidatus Peregrinibacteria bacterium Greene0416_62]|nr:MAG: glycosyl transferase 2 [Candidatus Peregrinibacteria bacterium Greene0416_62]TSC98904.1 MAG: glycosyl transferase 2 [Candidatus Peregrinibacteria bacterium Greene1014_49]